jgi:type II secretory pathway component PulK
MRTNWGLLISSSLMLLTALAACVAALGSHRAAKHARRHAQAQWIYTIFETYGSNVLLDAEIKLHT